MPPDLLTLIIVNDVAIHTSSFIVNELAPKEAKGFWTGLMEALNAAITGVVPLGMATLYDSIQVRVPPYQTYYRRFRCTWLNSLPSLL